MARQEIRLSAEIAMHVLMKASSPTKSGWQGEKRKPREEQTWELSRQRHNYRV